MVPLLKNPAKVWERAALTTHGRLNHAIRDNRYRLIRYKNGDEELYDHMHDPMEWKNLAENPKYSKVKQRLAQWFPSKNAPDAPFDASPGGKKKKKKQQVRRKKNSKTPK